MLSIVTMKSHLKRKIQAETQKDFKLFKKEAKTRNTKYIFSLSAMFNKI